ncbi:ABC transporter permease [Camelimonas abortus]|uniref:ABC transporter permease n=1 Tax=Camelimonas abortus TaxID=1017184 RepID=A0ABV7LAX0_9HYPH
MNVANIASLGVKELRGLLRDPMLLLLIVWAFSASIYTASRALPETLNKAPIAIVDEDVSPVSARIGGAFYPPYFLPPRHISAREMDARMDAGLDTFAIGVPPNFQRDLLAGRAPTIQLNVDATRISQAFAGAGYIQSILNREISAFLSRAGGTAPPPVELTLRARFNPALDKAWFGSITNMISSVTMLSIILTGAALIREREHGTIEHLLVMPVRPVEIMISKIWSMGLVVWLATLFALLAVVRGALGVPTQGSLALFMACVALMLFATTSLGIFLATIAGSMPQFGMLLILVLIPLQVLSGGMTPRESMPEIVQTIMLAAPNTHFIIMSQAILFRGAGLSVIWPQALALLGVGLALFWLALRQFRRFLK